jgi:C4-dicarboxylate transporter DctM subunit
MDGTWIILAVILAFWLVSLLFGLPLYIAFLAATVPILFLVAGQGPLSLGKVIVDTMSSFTLIAIPLFILLGNTMSVCGATTVLFGFARAMVGHVRGGLGMATLVASAMFGTVCGSSVATALAVTTVAGPELLKSGYRRETIAAICAAGGGLGLLIPPSIDFIILGEILGLSVGTLFIAGIVPGLITLALLCAATHFSIGRRKEVEISQPASWQTRGRAFVRVLPVASIPLAIIGTLWGGIATPTEIAGVGAFLGLLLARFYFRKLGWGELKKIMIDTVRMSAAMMCVILAVVAFGRALSFEQIPQMLGNYVVGMGLELPAFKAFYLGLFFFMGMVFEFVAMAFVALPPLVPAVMSYDISLIAFAVTFCMIGFVGQLTPPVAMTLYAGSTGIGASVTKSIKEIPLYLIVWIVATVSVLYMPFLAVY